MADRILVMNEGRAEQIASPLELYNEPRNQFVADFIGESNLLTGRVSSRDEDTVDVELEAIDQGPFTVSREVVMDGADEADAVLLNLRPEDVSVTKAVSGNGQAFEGTVANKTFLGNLTQLLVDVDGTELLVETPGRAAQRQFSAGERVAVEWQEDECLLLEARA